MKYPFTIGEFKVILKILRETYGWSRKKAHIFYANIARSTGLSKRWTIEICKRLEKRKVIFIEHTDSDANLIGINKNYDDWQKRLVHNFDPSERALTGGVSGSSLGGSEGSLTPPSEGALTHSKKRFKETNGKKAEKKANRLVDNLESKKAMLSNLIKGSESLIESNDPRALVNKLIEYGFDLDKVWGVVVQARTKRNPPGYLVSVLADPDFAVADSSMEQAKQEMRKYGF